MSWPALTAILRGSRRVVRDGCGARRWHLLDTLEPAPRIVHLPVAGAVSLPDRVRSHLEALVTLLREATCPGGPLRVFYPELPFFFPPHPLKLVPALVLYLVLRVLASVRRRAIEVDVVDIPRWQHVTLALGPVRYPRMVRFFEAVLFRIANRVIVPSSQLAGWLGTDLGVRPDRFEVSPHLPPVVPVEVVDRGKVARVPSDRPVGFLYLGGLSRRQDRGIVRLLDAFVRAAPGWARLELAGEDGAWIPGAYPHRGVTYQGLLDEADCVRLASRCQYGLIPYPEWGYYRTVLPSKLSFYASCGLIVLSTRLPEVESWIRAGGRGRTIPFAVFGEIFRRSDLLDLAADRPPVMDDRSRLPTPTPGP